MLPRLSTLCDSSTNDEQLEELQDDKTALRVMFEDEQVAAAGLRHGLKRTEATIAQLSTRLTTLNSGAKDLQVKLAAAAATEATSMVKWDADNQPALYSLETRLSHSKSRHIKIQFHYLKDLLRDGELHSNYCPTEDMVAEDCQVFYTLSYNHV